MSTELKSYPIQINANERIMPWITGKRKMELSQKIYPGHYRLITLEYRLIQNKLVKGSLVGTVKTQDGTAIDEHSEPLSPTEALELYNQASTHL